MSPRAVRLAAGLAALAALATVLLALTAAPASAYQYLSDDEGLPPSHWLQLPLPLTIDNGPTDVSGEIAEATATWNNVTTAKNPWGTLTEAVDGTGNPVDFTKDNFETAWGDPDRRRPAGGRSSTRPATALRGLLASTPPRSTGSARAAA